MVRGKFIAEMEYGRYLIECRADVAERITDIQRRFDEWLYNRSNNHGLWLADPNGNEAVSYGINDFLGWLNNHYDCDAKTVADEKAGLHHIDEYNAWLRERGLAQGQAHFVSTLEEYNKLNGSDFSDWAKVIKSAPVEPPAEEYQDPLRHFAEFEKATSLTPEILKLHREENVPLIYF